MRNEATIGATKKLEKPSPTKLPLPFQLDPEPAEEMLTALGGVPLLAQSFGSLGLPASVKGHVHVKERQRGYDEATLVESFVILNAVGGECLEDFDGLREDGGLAELIGHQLPSPAAARKFLYEFHDEEKIQAAQGQLRWGQVAYVPEENEPLRGLGQVNCDLVQVLGQRCPDHKIATVDLDSTIVESCKREAQMTYEGVRGYQPMLALWAEMNGGLRGLRKSLDLQPLVYNKLKTLGDQGRRGPRDLPRESDLVS